MDCRSKELACVIDEALSFIAPRTEFTQNQRIEHGNDSIKLAWSVTGNAVGSWPASASISLRFWFMSVGRTKRSEVPASAIHLPERRSAWSGLPKNQAMTSQQTRGVCLNAAVFVSGTALAAGFLQVNYPRLACCCSQFWSIRTVLLAGTQVACRMPLEIESHC